MSTKNNVTFQFEGQNVLITGGAQGIGLQIAGSFLAAGSQVTVWDYSEQALSVASQELAKFGNRFCATQANVAELDSCLKAAQRLPGPLDVLVNNAGIVRDKSFAKMSAEEFGAVIGTNLTGVFNVTKSVLDRFREGSSCKRIINISSVVALYGNFGQTNYVAAKAGVIGMTKTWGRELARKGFTVNAIAPGFTRTQMVQTMPKEVLDKMANQVPVGRLGETQDIATAVLFLASQEAGYINGTILSVDGGLVC